MRPFMLFYLLTFFSCIGDGPVASQPGIPTPATSDSLVPAVYTPGSWQRYLQDIPEKEGPILDFKGAKVRDQGKHTAILPFDVGTRDLQQCADALMRLRAEYLFGSGRTSEIAFHFTDGTKYPFLKHCEGWRPLVKGNSLVLGKRTGAVSPTHKALRNYLDIVYTYAGTISLAKELKMTEGFDVGTIVITPGSPGHCFIIKDKARLASGGWRYKLAEGYTPAQSMYVLSRPDSPGDPWYALAKGTIETSSYTFTRYKLGTFE